jgi:hypothetical protein|tara:strand:+ start:400 stop:636 length:237 start_codon:yes stop_codon:yes gene_type:complete
MEEKNNKTEPNYMKSNSDLYEAVKKYTYTTHKMSKDCSKTWMLLKLQTDAKRVEDVMWRAIKLLKKELQRVSYESDNI